MSRTRLPRISDQIGLVMARTSRALMVGSLTASAICLASVVASTVPASATTPTVSRASAEALVPARAKPVFLASAARFGTRGSQSVRNMQSLLIRKGYATTGLRQAGATGSYYKQTRASVRTWQRRLGYRHGAADGIIGRTSATRLGLRWVTSSVQSKPTTTTTTSGGSTSSAALSPRQLKSVLAKAGFREPSIRIAWAIAMRESRGYPRIVSPKNSNGTRDYGLFQINDVHRSSTDFSRILEPVYNAAVAYRLSSSGTDFSHWGIGDKGWAGYLHKSSPKYWKMLQDEMLRFKAQYPG